MTEIIPLFTTIQEVPCSLGIAQTRFPAGTEPFFQFLVNAALDVEIAGRCVKRYAELWRALAPTEKVSFPFF